MHLFLVLFSHPSFEFILLLHDLVGVEGAGQGVAADLRAQLWRLKSYVRIDYRHSCACIELAVNFSRRGRSLWSGTILVVEVGQLVAI